MGNKILLVEDEADMALIVSDTLRRQGYEVVTASDGIDGLDKFRRENVDIVVADVMMPRMDGFEMGRRIRTLSPSVPLLYLTAKSTIDDMETGFNSGADDYLKKPFELRELLLRIKSLLRRNTAVRNNTAEYILGSYIFNVSAQTLSCPAHNTELSNFEAKLLELLAAAGGRTVDATELMIALWQHDNQSNRNSLHGYIHKLRRLLRHDPRIKIINRRGFGYMLSVPSGK